MLLVSFSVGISARLTPHMRYLPVEELKPLSDDSFNSNNYEGLFFKQKLNHSQIDSETWDQVNLTHLFVIKFKGKLKLNYFKRYFINTDFFDGSGPVFLMVGQESESSGRDLNFDSYNWASLGKQHVFMKYF